MKPVLEVKGLTRDFGGLRALNELDLTCLLYTSPSPRDTR